MTTDSDKFPSPWAVQSDSQVPRCLDGAALDDDAAEVADDAEPAQPFSPALPRALTIAADLDGKDPWKGSSDDASAPCYDSNPDGAATDADHGGFGAAHNSTQVLGSGFASLVDRDPIPDDPIPDDPISHDPALEPVVDDAPAKADPWGASSNNTQLYPSLTPSPAAAQATAPAPSLRALSVDDDAGGDPWGAPHNATQRYGVDGSTIEPSLEGDAADIVHERAARDDVSHLPVSVDDATSSDARASLPPMRSSLVDADLDDAHLDDNADAWAGNTQRFGTGSMTK